MDYREPCPYRIIDDCGGAFALGVIGSSVFNVFKGVKNSSKGKRLYSSLSLVRTNSPVTGGSFAMWGLTFSSIDCMAQAVRKKEDPWNSIFSGAATGGILAWRGGKAQALASALIGGVLLAAIEGVGIAITYFSANTFREANFRAVAPPGDPSQLGALPNLQTS